MDWYIAVIIILSASTVGSIVLITELISTVNNLREDNAKLRIDLRHK